MAVVRTADSQVPDVGDGLWERVRDAVQAESGAATSLWNGRIDYTKEPGNRGEAWDNGTVCFDQALVVQHLQEMYATRGQPATREQWIARRNALKTVAHEFSHLASPDGYTHADRLAGMQKPETRPIEEGVTEAWSQAALDDLADRVLPPDLAAEIKAVRDDRGPHSYPGWEPAARAFANSVGNQTGLEGDEVLRQMAKEPRTTKARAAADLLYDNSELPNLVPAEREEAVRQEIAETIDKGFAELEPLNADQSVNRRAVSKARGAEIGDSASGVVRAAEERHRGGPNQEQQQEETLDLGALPPPNAADRIPTREEPAQQQTPAAQATQQQAVDPRVAFAQQPGSAGPGQQQAGTAQAGQQAVDPRVAFAQQSPAQQQAQLGASTPGETRRTGAAEQDVAALRGVLEDQPSAAGAPRVPQGQAAEGRRPTGQGAAAGRSTEHTPTR
ncbi:hypothetical protein ACIA49_05245 [Kribbella sp. NPDC051587]|uniref:hypothetical protein n=1 Tax=Kribbella sp. NPDC051587 TaxID=3364119 RepID=UPI0037A330C7